MRPVINNPSVNHTPEEKKRRLIFVWNYLNWGGAQIYLLAIMKIARHDWDIVVILPKNSSSDIINFLDQLDIRCEFLDRSLDPKPATSVRRKVERQVRRISSEAEMYRHLSKYDLRESIVHIETAPWQSWMLLTALSLKGAHTFMTLHNFIVNAPKLRELIWKARLQFVSRLPGVHFIASNRDTKARLKGWVNRIFWEKITVAHTCVDPPQIEAAFTTEAEAIEIRERHSIPRDRIVVLAVGQFVDRKGRWIFLEAGKKVLNKNDEVCFVWLTPEMPESGEQEKIASYDLGDSFKLVLSKTVGAERIDVLRFFTAADIFALPSFIEGLPIALLEAMALGLPSISTNVYAIPEAVKHNETGLLIEPGDSDSLAASILKLIFDPALRSLLSSQGSKFVLENFDERDAARKCLAAYLECFENVA